MGGSWQLKTVFQEMAEMGKRMFPGDNANVDLEVDIGDWVFRNGKILPARLKITR